jgi:hypothetical protein
MFVFKKGVWRCADFVGFIGGERLSGWDESRVSKGAIGKGLILI